MTYNNLYKIQLIGKILFWHTYLEVIHTKIWKSNYNPKVGGETRLFKLHFRIRKHWKRVYIVWSINFQNSQNLSQNCNLEIIPYKITHVSKNLQHYKGILDIITNNFLEGIFSKFRCLNDHKIRVWYKYQQIHYYAHACKKFTSFTNNIQSTTCILILAITELRLLV